ncbi:glycine cleavage system protein GcvH [Reticulibacter mediterranei]|uniref:Glycine cleavage system H protein n=1 Tax=Reticulibacter mediterranei TaxID=2778369 RepID=A0A8J3N8D6_9CHLR|nr:glycine cleavage system protein GcvH [Reticulibacter mediterranei]GHO98147.1 glycine cleavage system protein GcvH [Reticulibacter mediterranei]
MSTNPSDLKYSKDHEWVRANGTQAIIGITSYAQKQLGDIVFIELPKVGDSFEIGEAIGSIESVKAVAEIYMPLKGKIVEINAEANDDPELVNTDPYGEGWLLKFQIANTSQLKDLMSADKYDEFIREEQG